MMADDAPRSRDLVSLLLVSLERLAAAGEVEAACRLAGEACALLRPHDVRATRRFDALLHRLTRPVGPALRAARPRHHGPPRPHPAAAAGTLAERK